MDEPLGSAPMLLPRLSASAPDYSREAKQWGAWVPSRSLLASIRATPQRLTEARFQFSQPNLDKALASALRK